MNIKQTNSKSKDVSSKQEDGVTHIFFDVGSVLLKRKDDLWQIASDSLGVSRVAYAQAVADIHHNHALTQQLWQEATTLEKEEVYYAEFTREIQRRLGLEIDEVKTRNLVGVFSHRSYDVAKGTHDLLKWLRERGYKLGVISNAPVSRRHYEMKEHKLEQYFDVVVLSRDIAIDKPHPGIYEHALKLAGATAGASAMVDDKVENVVAAQALGFGVVVLFGNDENARRDNIRRILRLGELKEIF